MACPNKQVVAVIGDGGFVLSGLELLTAYREKINFLVVVLNDGYFRFMALMPMLRRRWKADLREWAKEGRRGLEQARVSLQNIFDQARR